MYGLRLINNNYVANGTGRDLTINYDPGYRGGKFLQGQQQSHLPKPWVGSSKAKKDNIVKGLDARDEGYKQTLNTSRSAFHEIGGKRDRLTASRRYHFPLVANTTLNPMSGTKFGVSQELVRAASSPCLGVASPVYRPRWDVPAMELDSSQGFNFGKEAPVEVKEAGPEYAVGYWKPKEPFLSWPAPSFVHPTSGFSRTDGGCPWPN
eukprot:TRINITY_DN8593_c0_g1_i1.p1 TRINITY_DN8593_c0_g1~~TRINITY_DN8593_c0_g1_i1.p1  ORF type:complete len:207 (+),score=36.65 TRINITY_DN8593_c0_g1_i1:144-764(+)